MNALMDSAAVIHGDRVSGPDRLEVIDPSTGELLGTTSCGTAAEIGAAVDSAREAFELSWGTFSSAERATVLKQIAAAIRDEVEEFAMLESRDTGKPLRQARADTLTAARYFEYYGGIAETLEGETIPSTGDIVAMTLREPYGITAHITPWNYPIQIAGRSLAPALAAGNTCVLKPAEAAPFSSIRLAEVALGAGLPPGALNVVPGLGVDAGAALAGHPGIDHLTFTGSQAVGTQVMKLAAENIVPVGLELGGKSPNIVFADADIDAAIPYIVNSVIQNAGQTCSAGSRLLVHESLQEVLMRRLADALDSVVIGPGPSDPDLGPLISEQQRERVAGFIEEAHDSGATLQTRKWSASELPPKGFFVAPTLFSGVQPESRLAQEEVFGPVLAVTSFSSDREAIELANSTRFGLIAAVWTRDVARAHAVARALRTGQVFINSYGAGGGVELPFGGYKRSGFGRAKGRHGLLEYSQVKTVTVKLDHVI